MIAQYYADLYIYIYIGDDVVSQGKAKKNIYLGFEIPNGEGKKNLEFLPAPVFVVVEALEHLLYGFIMILIMYAELLLLP